MLCAGLSTIPALALAESHLDGLTVQGTQVSADLNAVSLAVLLREMGQRAGFAVVLQGDLDHLVSAHFRDLPMDAALRRVVGSEHALVMRYEPAREPGMPGRLLEVRVYGDVRGDPDRVTVAPVAPRGEGGAQKVEAPPGPDPEAPGAYSGPAGMAAVRALAARGDAASVAALGRILDTSSDPAVRREAIEALSRIGGEEAADALAHGLGDDDSAIRTGVVDALGDMGDEHATRMLGQVLFSESEPDIRLTAVARLGERDSDAARAFLDAAADDPDPLVRDAARKALGRAP